MRERALRTNERLDGDDDERAGGRRFAVWAWMRAHPKDALAGLVAAAGVSIILSNALLMQNGPHPAPIFAQRATTPVPSAAAPAPAVIPRPRPDPAAGRPRAEIVAELQRELGRRGFYEGAADGVYGSKTDIAIRDFEQAAGLRPSTEPNDALLQALVRSPVKAKPAQAAPRDPIAALLGPDKRLMAVQRALSDYGYGQIKPTGVYGPETRSAVERFERERRLPSSGQVTDRLVRELSAVTGRPLD